MAPQLLKRRTSERNGPPGPPDFVGAGFQVSGAQWWFEKLLAHPQIYGPAADDPELRFFVPFCEREFAEEDVAAYHAFFPAVEDGITGEWSARYARDPWTGPLLERAAPDARILLMASDPLERYRQRVRALDGKPAARQQVPFFTQIVAYGRYGSMLRSLLRHVDRERVLVLQLERCRTAPEEEYARTLRFLGVSDDFRPRGLARGADGSAEQAAADALRREGVDSPGRFTRRGDLWPHAEETLHYELDPEVRALRELAPELDLALWPSFAHLDEHLGAPA